MKRMVIIAALAFSACVTAPGPVTVTVSKVGKDIRHSGYVRHERGPKTCQSGVCDRQDYCTDSKGEVVHISECRGLRCTNTETGEELPLEHCAHLMKNAPR